ncbi:hypothetical protein DES36_103117 [Alkalibaculum bacchi]|uniref:BofC-like protein n=1 Tax=Alkalibaculum bacchi TaxID=645887 RepID=A0A366IC57_9FIRM|nr:hypothetical protein [Alkalibaculum bacchi]RBP68355.1 hypothetical protein DES36_103117 [Alkalibaculum bacchi]
MKSPNGSSMRRKGIGVGVALIVIFGLILGYLSADLFSKIQDSRDASKGRNIAEVARVSATDMGLGENATIYYNRVYTKCNEVSTEQKVADNTNIGKNKNQLSEIYSEWNIVELTSDKLVLQKNIDSYSPDYYKVGTHDDGQGHIFVAVYTYNIEGMEVLDNITSTPIELVYSGEREKLEGGIIVKGEENLYELLENYDE